MGGRWKTMLSTFDQDKKGKISLNEFLAASVSKTALLTKKNIRVLYNTYDPTGKGYITIDDFRRTNPEYKES